MAEPKVRFKRDDGSSYPAWTEGKLGDITEKVDRKAPRGSDAPIMMISQGNGFIYQADKYSRENAGQSLKNYTLLEEGEFAYNHGASKAKPYGVAYCLKEEAEARVPFVYHTFKITEGINQYWHEALNTSKMDRQLKRMVSSGARMDGLLNINYDTYMDVDINIPCIEEQQKIANFLFTVDEVITASEEEVTNLETQKKAVMKKIFSREVRFKRSDGSEFPEWKEKTFEDIFDVITDYVAAGSFADISKNVQYLDKPDYAQLVRTVDVKNSFRNKGFVYVDKRAFDYLYRVELDKEPHIILPNIGANIGEYYLVEPRDLPYERNVLGPNAIMLGTTNNIYFWAQYLGSENFQKNLALIVSSTGQPKFNKTDLRKVAMMSPCEEEQRLIADFLSDFDEAITAAKKELELWKELKKGLLQQMFV